MVVNATNVIKSNSIFAFFRTANVQSVKACIETANSVHPLVAKHALKGFSYRNQCANHVLRPTISVLIVTHLSAYNAYLVSIFTKQSVLIAITLKIDAPNAIHPNVQHANKDISFTIQSVILVPRAAVKNVINQTFVRYVKTISRTFKESVLTAA